MAGKLTPAGVFGKWVIAPALLALFGYLVIGPQVGKSLESVSKISKSTSSEPANADPPDVNTPRAGKGKSPAPEVDVTVHKDEGGSAGSTTAG